MININTTNEVIQIADELAEKIAQNQIRNNNIIMAVTVVTMVAGVAIEGLVSYRDSLKRIKLAEDAVKKAEEALNQLESTGQEA